MILQTSDSPNLKVLLTSDTEVGQVQGVFQARRKEMAMAALIPGLKVKVEGTHNEQGELVATSVSFKGNDLERAETIQAGLHETHVQAEQNKQAIEEHNSALQQQQQQISANKTAIDAAVARFGELDDYYILDEVTVHFDNGKVQVDQQYIPQVLQLAEKASSINGYVIEVKGYASEVGSKVLNASPVPAGRIGRGALVFVEDRHNLGAWNFGGDYLFQYVYLDTTLRQKEVPSMASVSPELCAEWLRHPNPFFLQHDDDFNWRDGSWAFRRHALEVLPQYTSVLLGNQKWSDAVSLIGPLLPEAERTPAGYLLLYHHAYSLHQMGKLQEAVDAYRRVNRVRSANHPEVYGCGSSMRRLPDAALRGLANGASPASTCFLFSARNAFLVM
jgi:outer membrane protein OmpA-like peptidoglycan-associated protein